MPQRDYDRYRREADRQAHETWLKGRYPNSFETTCPGTVIWAFENADAAAAWMKYWAGYPELAEGLLAAWT